MGSKQPFPILRGKQTWKQLQEIARFGYSSPEIFSDFVDICLNALLSFTNNMRYFDIAERLNENKFTGIYEDRYMQLVAKYKENKTRKAGNRPADFFTNAWGCLQYETQASQEDVLGHLYEGQISLGEHGQFFTPSVVTTMIDQMVGISDGERVNDPACGSGRFFINMAKLHKDKYLHFYGVDLAPVCAKMTALNMWLFNLNADICQGNSLSVEMSYLWRIRKGGFIWETRLDQMASTIVEEQPAKEKLISIQKKIPTEVFLPQKPVQVKNTRNKKNLAPTVQQSLF